MLPTLADTARILIADDQSDLVDALRLLLKPEGIAGRRRAFARRRPRGGRASAFDLVLMDLNYTGDTTSGREGIDLLSRLQAIDASLPVVVMTGWGSIDLAVEAMRRGVRDFVQKPWDNAALVTMLRTEIADRARAAAAGAARSSASWTRPAASSGRCCRRRCRRWTASSWRHRGNRPPASAATASTRSGSRRSRLALSIADVVGKGIPAALLMSNLQAAVRAFATEAARPEELCEQVNTRALRPYRRRSVHQLLLLRRRLRRSGSLVVRERRSLSAGRRARRRHRRPARPTGGAVLGVFADGQLRGRDRPVRRRAIGWSSIPTASPRPGTRRTRSSATTGCWRSPSSTVPAARRRCRRGWWMRSPRSPAGGSPTTPR